MSTIDKIKKILYEYDWNAIPKKEIIEGSNVAERLVKECQLVEQKPIAKQIKDISDKLSSKLDEEAKLTDTEKLREGINNLITKYGEAMKTETNQYPEYIVTDQILQFLKSLCQERIRKALAYLDGANDLKDLEWRLQALKKQEGIK